ATSRRASPRRILNICSIRGVRLSSPAERVEVGEDGGLVATRMLSRVTPSTRRYGGAGDSAPPLLHRPHGLVQACPVPERSRDPRRRAPATTHEVLVEELLYLRSEVDEHALGLADLAAHELVRLHVGWTRQDRLPELGQKQELDELVTPEAQHGGLGVEHADMCLGQRQD